MKAEPLGLAGLFAIVPDVTQQPQGRFTHHFSERDFERLGANGRCVQEHASCYPLRHTVRGLHFQTLPHPQTKYVRVARGRIHDVVVDVRRGSPTWGRHTAIELVAGDWRQLHVPPGFAHGFCTLEVDTEVVFRLTDYNDPTLLRGLRWNDAALGIAWPCGDTPAFVFPVDRELPRLAALVSPFDWTEHW